MIENLLKYAARDHLARNSFFIMMGTGVVSGFGFIFWIIAARMFSTESVGIATTTISATSLISLLSQLGANISLIRFLPTEKNRSALITSWYLLVAATTFILCFLFLLFINIFSPGLKFISENIFYFISFCFFGVATSLNSLQESTFTAYRAAHNIFIKNTIISVFKVALPVLLVGLGAYGIFSSVSIAIIAGITFGFYSLIKNYNYHPTLSFDQEIVKKTAHYSLINYAVGFLYQAPNFILPLIILNLLAAKSAAFFYIDSMIFNLLIVVPLASSQSLLTEGSYSIEDVRNHTARSIKITAGLLIPAILVIFFFGNLVLKVFGKSYEAEAFELLRLFAISSFFTSFILIGTSILRISHRLGQLLILNFIGCASTIIFCVFLARYGLVTIGWGFLASQILTSIFFALSVKEEFITGRRLKK
ncbi:MAG TPA: lipopolysaccharide biosynthesis protein [Patescibacteria group bacterium]|nr:lipopolysaccharide biosynthesis protein [Patescibacteria group bacterium]